MIQGMVKVLLERRLLYVGLALVPLVLLLFLGSTVRSLHDLERRIEKKERKLSEILKMGRDLEEIRKRISTTEALAIGGEERKLLLPALSRLAEKAGVKGKVATMDTRSRRVLPSLVRKEIYIRMEGLSWKEMRSFLRVIGDYRETFHLKEIRLAANYQDPKLFDASIVLIVFEKG